MKDAKNFLRVAGMILLGVFVVAVAAPLVIKLVLGLVGFTFGVTLGIFSLLISLAVLLIKVAVVLAIGYLVLIGIRALLR